MHSTLVRIQNVFGFFTTVAFCLAILVALSVVSFPQSPSASLQLRNVQVVKGRPHYYSTKREEYAHVKFDLDMDLTSFFNWNTKQVFVYVKASYPSSSPSDPPSQAIIWDAIIPGVAAPWHHNQYVPPSSKPSGGKKSKSKPPQQPLTTTPGLLKLDNQRPKYQITDASGQLAERANATLELGWNIQPWVGLLSWSNWGGLATVKEIDGGRTEPFDFPDVVGQVKKEELKTEVGGEGNRGKPA
ncbi:signal peptidase subunit-domain-containing protein [Lineolata rhizophorae]|uniref:Signal peptidase subunit 3 n=1 Tax=Lineolata rhizophorae TaxID=578093 RepID=A0A6A6NV53_9PEZI|nr:signal peptidase subunit-domain-containing protein [Lineolata rhizophorae]